MSLIRKSAGRQRGTALMEFALVFPFLLVLTLGVMDLSRAFFVKNLLYQSAREGVRRVVVQAAGDTSGVGYRVSQVVAPAKIKISKLTVTSLSDHMLSVSVETQFNWLFPGLFRWLGANFTNPVALKGVATMRREGA